MEKFRNGPEKISGKNFGKVDYIDMVFIIKNTMKKIVCLIVKKITFGKVCLGWCNL